MLHKLIDNLTYFLKKLAKSWKRSENFISEQNCPNVGLLNVACLNLTSLSSA